MPIQAGGLCHSGCAEEFRDHYDGHHCSSSNRASEEHHGGHKLHQPLPTFGYVPVAGREPSHGHAPTESLYRSDELREIARSERSAWSCERNHDHLMGADAW